MTLWVTWRAKYGSRGESMPKSSVAHAADGMVRDASAVRGGGFPLACGLYAPDGFDAEIEVSHGRRCRRCEKALAKREAA